MAEKEQKGVKGLVLRGGGDTTLNDQRGEETADLLVAELGGGPTAHKSLKTSDPETVNLQGFGRIIAEFDFSFEFAIFPLPRGFW
jgi:hypothetical protein